MAVIATPPKLQFFDANGAPLVGGKLYSYAAGTTTPQATYTDAGGVTPNANPIILDSRGEASVWLGTALYKFKLTTSTDVEVWTVDNVGGFATLAQLAASGGSALVGFIQTGTGAVATTVQAKLRETVSVKDFGAVGNGVADDTAAIQAAIDTGKDVIFPDAAYKITAQLSVGSQRLIGGVGSKSINRPQSIITIAGNHPCFVNKSGEISFEINGFYIDYGDAVPTNAGTSSNKIGFYFTNNVLWPAFSLIKNCTVRGAWEGYYDNTGTYQSILELVFTLKCRRAFFKQNGTTIKFDTCMAQEGKQGFYIVDVLSPTLVNVAADQLSVSTTENTGNYFEGCRSLSINGWDAESNAMVGDTVSYMRVRSSAAHIAGFVGYLNTLNCNSGQEVYLFKVDEGSTANFSGCRPARNTSDLAFLGAGGGSPHTLLAYDTAKVALTGCNFSAPTGGTPSVSYVSNAQLSSTVQYLQSTLTGTAVNTFDTGYGPTASGSWTPNLSGFTIVGSPTVSGKYVRDNNVVHCWVTFDCSVGNTVASVAGTSVINNFPASLTPVVRSTCAASNEAVASFGNGAVTSVGTYTPAWTASTVDVYVYFSYYIGA
jgi:hypothetical protein